MRKIIDRHKSLWAQRSFILQVGAGVLLLVFGIFATYFANIYTTIRASNAVTDLILDNVPVVNVNFVFTDGAMFFVLFLAAVVALTEQKDICPGRGCCQRVTDPDPVF